MIPPDQTIPEPQKVNPKLFISIPTDPNEMVESQYGYIPYLHWCNSEVSRMKVNGRKAVVVTCDDGKVCVSRPNYPK
jgi:hypothetical protein